MATRSMTLSKVSSTVSTVTVKLRLLYSSGAYFGFKGLGIYVNNIPFNDTSFNITIPESSTYGWNKRYDNGVTYSNTNRIFSLKTSDINPSLTGGHQVRKRYNNGMDHEETFVLNLGLGSGRTNSTTITAKVVDMRYGTEPSGFNASDSLTVTTDAIPEPPTPTCTYVTSGNDGYGNPTSVTVSVSCTNPENFYTLTLENSGGTVLQTAKSAGPLTHRYTLNASTYDRTWSFRGRIAGGGINKSSALLNIFHATPTLPIWYFLPGTGVAKQVRQMVYYNSSGVAKKVTKVYPNIGGIFK